MLGVCCPEYLPCSTSHAAGPPPPPCTSPEMYIALVVAAPVALIFLLLRNLHGPQLAQLPDEVHDQILATPQDLDAPTVSSSTTPSQAEVDGSGSRRASDDEGVGVEEGEAVRVEEYEAVGVEEAVAVGVEEDEAVRVEEYEAVGVEEYEAVGVEESEAVGVEEEEAVGVEEYEAVAVAVKEYEAVRVEEVEAVGVEEYEPEGVEEAVAVAFKEYEAVRVEEVEAVGVGKHEAVEEDVGVGVEGGVGVGVEAIRAELAPTFINATADRSAVVAGIPNKILDAFGGIHLDTRSSDESTIHPANGVLIQSMEIFCENTDKRVQAIFGTGDYTVEPYSVMLDCWIAKLEEDAEGICRGEKGRKYIFLLNNTYDVWQRVRCPSAPFSNPELTNRFIPMIQRYKMCYFDECWVPLTNTRRLGKFTLVFHTICKPQMAWQVTAELRYTFRQEILDLILPSYELSLLAHQANQSPLSEILYWLKRVMAGKKKQKKLTVEKLEKDIKDLFEGFTPS